MYVYIYIYIHTHINIIYNTQLVLTTTNNIQDNHSINTSQDPRPYAQSAY